jgi:hypothetical protein
MVKILLLCFVLFVGICYLFNTFLENDHEHPVLYRVTSGISVVASLAIAYNLWRYMP